MAKQYYTVEQISRLLDIHPKTVQRYIREGKISASKIGKSWRVSGHDLSAFAENAKNKTSENAQWSAGQKEKVNVSCVADINVTSRDEAIRIMNTLSAVLNVKPPEYGNSTMYTQFIETEVEGRVRVTLWGNISFTVAMLQSIEALTDHFEEEQ
jgi:excisionase family DNA binding protein